MPSQLSYPGVYVEEIPSGVRTIAAVATSITAFIGRAAKGPTDVPVTITSFGDFERKFGGLWKDSTMSYAVRDFYLNGGSLAVIVRIHKDAVAATLTIKDAADAADLAILQASSAGAWGNKLSIGINHNIEDPTAPPPDDDDTPPTTGFFNLIVYQKDAEGKNIKVEEHLNVSFDKDETRYLPKVLENYSTLLKIETEVVMGDPAGIPAVDDSPPALENGNDGTDASDDEYKTGLDNLKQIDLFNLLCIPPPSRSSDPTKGANTSTAVYDHALAICNEERAILLVDSPIDWGTTQSSATENAKNGLSSLGFSGTAARNAAIYFPRVLQQDPLSENQVDTFVACGIIAGAISRNDTQRGIWKSPAGTEVGLNGIVGLQANLNDLENGQLNPLGINCLRNLPGIGRVVWGARTLRGADILADEYKYLAVRRMLLFLQESLYRGLQWVVFEPNDEPLWASIRLNVGAFMNGLYRQGAFQGKKKDAYFVKCDSETTTQTDINSGIVNIVVGFAPLKPAEFVVIKFQQMAGQIDT